MLDFTGVKAITIPEGKVKKITRKSDGAFIWERKGFTNLVPLSTEADGKTIYNGGKGYKDKYRIRSSGAEVGMDEGTCTGYIQYTKSDKLYIYPPFTGGNTQNAINFYDGSFACIGQVTDSGGGYGICAGYASLFKTQVVNGVSVLDLSAVTISGVENIAFVRVTNDRYACENRSGSDMIITKNEEITL